MIFDFFDCGEITAQLHIRIRLLTALALVMSASSFTANILAKTVTDLQLKIDEAIAKFAGTLAEASKEARAKGEDLTVEAIMSYWVGSNTVVRKRNTLCDTPCAHVFSARSADKQGQQCGKKSIVGTERCGLHSKEKKSPIRKEPHTEIPESLEEIMKLTVVEMRALCKRFGITVPKTANKQAIAGMLDSKRDESESPSNGKGAGSHDDAQEEEDIETQEEDDENH